MSNTDIVLNQLTNVLVCSQHCEFMFLQALVFEDAPNGVEGALAAGMQVIWVPDPNMNTALFRDRVNAVYKSLEEFRPEDAGLPPYDS